jgi:protein tyrosine/serine phosphatase
MYRFLLVLLLLTFSSESLLAAEPRLRPESWATPVISEQLDNWYKVDERVYRSDQPDEEAMAELKKFGIRRVLSLRNFHDDEDEATGTGLKLYSVGMQAERFSDEQIIKALQYITESDEPILVHCWHGSDRTGTIIAMYRMVIQNWSREEALDELQNGGYGFHSLYRNIPKYIRNVDIEKIRRELNRQQSGD